MTLSIRISGDMESRLLEQARAAGKNIESYVADLLQEHASRGIEDVRELEADEWDRALDEWVNMHPNPEVLIDDSRESIYGERGL